MIDTLTLTQLAEHFHDLFLGQKRAYGVFQIQKTNEEIDNNFKGDGLKKEGKALTIKKEYNVDHWKKHLKGEQGLGIIPIMDNNKVHWGAIDIDIYDMDIVDFCKKVEDTKLVPCRTKSGGIHLYCFVEKPVTAKLMRNALHNVAKKLGFSGCEIFPKQEKVIAEKGDFGNWINMPYFDARNTVRFAILKGEKIGPKEFIFYAEKNKYQSKELKSIHEFVTNDTESYFVEGPPCLNHLTNFGFPKGSRNNSLFNIGIYYKKKNPDDFEQKIVETNKQLMIPPLSYAEVNNIVQSLKKKKYEYLCNEQPICNHCNKDACLERKYGIGEEKTKMPKMEDLVKIDADPPVYFLTVEGLRFGPFDSEILLNQIKFAKMVFEKVNLLVPPIRRSVWSKSINELLSDMTVVEVSEDDKPKQLIKDLLYEFCEGRRQTEIKKEMLLGRVYVSNSYYHFRFRDFDEFVRKTRRSEFSKSILLGMLTDIGVKDCRLFIEEDNGKIRRGHFKKIEVNAKISQEPVKTEEAPY